MTLKTFFDKFELLTDAPNAVTTLRQIILQLAVKGKLVSQDYNDETASILLEKISKRRSLMTSQGRPLFQNLSNVDKQPYQLPHNWKWAYLDNISIFIIGGGTPSKLRSEFWDGNIPWASVKDLKGKYLEKTIDSITELGLKNSSTNLVKKGSIIICTRMGLGKIAINTIDVAINQDLKAMKLPEEIDKIYFYNFYITQNIVGTGVTVSGIRQKDLLRLAVPIPPLAEQKRIVEKCDRLMSLCDQIEVRQQKRQESIVKMNESAITQLLSSQNPDEFSQHWQRICNNFDLLYSIPETIPKLRQAILQLAVQGKLVRQDPNDEPVSILLEKIEFEKERLLKEEKPSKSKLNASINSDEITYEIPRSWHWLRLGDLVESMNNGLYKPARFYSEDGIACVRMFNIQDGRLDFTETKRVIVDEDELENYKLELGDLIVNRVNSRKLVGKAALVQEIKETLIYEAMNIRVRFIYKQTLPAYINLLFRTNTVRAIFQGDAKQASGQASVSQPQVANILVPLPPLAEQQRIVAKVDHLISLCDTLEAKLKEALEHSEMLMEVAAKQVLVA